jgi:hypothetical protein
MTAHNPTPTPDRDEPLNIGWYALARNADAVTNLEQARIVRAGDGLEADGSDFVEAINFYLTALACPAGARELVVCLVGFSGGSLEELEVDDKLLASRADCSSKTVQRMRRSLIEWEEKKGLCVVEVTEGDFDKAAGKNRPTRYRVPLVRTAAEIVMRARSSPAWSNNTRSAIKEAANRLAKETSGGAPVKRRHDNHRRDPAAQIMTIKKTMLTKLGKACDLERARGNSPSDFWEPFKVEAEAVINGANDKSRT